MPIKINKSKQASKACMGHWSSGTEVQIEGRETGEWAAEKHSWKQVSQKEETRQVKVSWGIKACTFKGYRDARQNEHFYLSSIPAQL